MGEICEKCLPEESGKRSDMPMANLMAAFGGISSTSCWSGQKSGKTKKKKKNGPQAVYMENRTSLSNEMCSLQFKGFWKCDRKINIEYK